MSTVQDSCEIDNVNNIPIPNSEISEKKQDGEQPKPMKIIEEIPVSCLEVGKKYKIHCLQTFVRKSLRVVGKIGIRIFLEPGIVVLPHRFKDLADYYTENQPQNIYMVYIGRCGKSNAYIIHFYNDEKLVELKTN